MRFTRLIFLLLVFFVASCSSTTRDYKGVYEEAENIDELDVPPGLDKPINNEDLTIRELGRSLNTYSIYEQNLKDKPEASALTAKYQGMAFKRDGRLFWLEVKAPANEVWGDLRSYFRKLGFEIAVDQSQIGFMQTDWRENRVDIPGSWLGSLFGALYSAEIMDRYRIRVEWDEEAKLSRVFVTHQGLREIVAGEDDNLSVVQTKWVVRPSDPELEVEMIMRFMAYRGIEESLAEKQIASTRGEQRIKLNTDGEQSSLSMQEPFQRAWRLVSIAIDRLGFQVEDKNRSAGVFYIQLPETFVIKAQSGLFSKLFSETVRPEHDKYLIILEEKGGQTVITVKSNGEVKQDFPKVSQKILKDIQDSII